MDRKQFLKSLAILPVLPVSCSQLRTTPTKNTKKSLCRVHPGDPGWPTKGSWDKLRQKVQGCMINIESPLDVCEIKAQDEACTEIFKKLTNPYYISNQPALTQTVGWSGAWTSASSVYAIETEQTADIVAAVNFARNHNLRLVIKGGAHSYQGRFSSSPEGNRTVPDLTPENAFKSDSLIER